ncbi:hypothetical protein BS50DRAFT_44021 [Corynespora cassiicola Philippines]|uniref:Uncharacterized protein n=1 Tax=Corynespora cassiicola Philippines TaxID=1448308 RepID=A0A2T2PD64_CORCC|nr:hypothetical protein BS50DRAFT_44021 [Corynespora cassiicola Philippines]
MRQKMDESIRIYNRRILCQVSRKIMTLLAREIRDMIYFYVLKNLIAPGSLLGFSGVTLDDAFVQLAAFHLSEAVNEVYTGDMALEVVEYLFHYRQSPYCLDYEHTEKLFEHKLNKLKPNKWNFTPFEHMREIEIGVDFNKLRWRSERDVKRGIRLLRRLGEHFEPRATITLRVCAKGRDEDLRITGCLRAFEQMVDVLLARGWNIKGIMTPGALPTPSQMIFWRTGQEFMNSWEAGEFWPLDEFAFRLLGWHE